MDYFNTRGQYDHTNIRVSFLNKMVCIRIFIQDLRKSHLDIRLEMQSPQHKTKHQYPVLHGAVSRLSREKF